MIQDIKSTEPIAKAYKGTAAQKDETPKYAFSLLFDKMLEAYTAPDNEYGEPVLKKKEVAKRLGISKDLFQKRINWEKPSKSRDTVIAICMILKADVPIINDALYLHSMPGLDPYFPTDYGIIQIVNDYGYVPLTIEIINERLQIKGLSPLQIPHRGNNNSQNNGLPFSVKGKRIVSPDNYFLEDAIYGDQNNSLCTEYHPSRYRVSTEMWIENKTTGNQFALSAETDGYQYRVKKNFGIKYYIVPVEHGFRAIEKIKPGDDNGEYALAYTELTDMALEELRKYFSCVNDTKNYKDRVSAKIIHDELHVFCESFNYMMPEMNEYYLTDYCNGKYTMYRSRQSMFMVWYLNDDEYRNYYGEVPKIFEVNLDQTLKKRTKGRYAEQWTRLLQRIKDRQIETIDNLLDKLANKKAYIRDISSIYEMPNEEIAYYGLEDQFGYKTIEDSEEIIIHLDRHSIPINVNSQTVEITTDDVKEGFVLGCKDIREIARLKLKHKNLKQIIPTKNRD